MIEKVEMILPSPRRSFPVLGAVFALTTPLGVAHADQALRFVQVGTNCSLYGPNFVDLGNGICGPVRGQVHVGSGAPGAQAVSNSGWVSNGTSNTALRTDGVGMVPGAGDARHLRVQSGTDPYGR